jgi:hypothetical protein
VVHDGGTLVRLHGCCSATSVTNAVAWLGTAGVAVHRVVELPTDPASPARAIADEVNLALHSDAPHADALYADALYADALYGDR